MRVLVVEPGVDYSPMDMASGWTKGFRQAGCEVVEFNLADRLVFFSAAHMDRDGQWERAFDRDAAIHLAVNGLEAACYEFAPDLVVIISGFFIAYDLYRLMRARGSTVVVVCSEEPYETERELRLAEVADVAVLNDPTNLELFRAVNPKSWYIPHAYDPDVHRPGPVTPAAVSDFAFVGTGFPSRIDFFEQVDWTGIDVALAGQWRNLTSDSPLRKHLAHDIGACCPNDQAVTLYQSTKVSANLYRRDLIRGGTAEGWAMSPRDVELAATGCFFLTEPRGENLQVLPMVPTFDGPGDFEDQLRWYLAHPDERADIAAAARRAVADRTFLKNAQELLRLLGS